MLIGARKKNAVVTIGLDQEVCLREQAVGDVRLAVEPEEAEVLPSLVWIQ